MVNQRVIGYTDLIKYDKKIFENFAKLAVLE